jgi:anti-sigma regulatory factor (Ser/Thr protein kinase)
MVGGGHLRVCATSSELTRVSEWVRAWMRANGLSDETADRVDLCSTEIVTNIIAHAYADDAARHGITLSLDRSGDAVRLEVVDDGRPFNPLTAAPPPAPTSADDVAIGGRGIPIVRHFADDLRYERVDGTNRLTVLHRCHHPSPRGGTP